LVNSSRCFSSSLILASGACAMNSVFTSTPRILTPAPRPLARTESCSMVVGRFSKVSVCSPGCTVILPRRVTRARLVYTVTETMVVSRAGIRKFLPQVNLIIYGVCQGIAAPNKAVIGHLYRLYIGQMAKCKFHLSPDEAKWLMWFNNTIE